MDTGILLVFGVSCQNQCVKDLPGLAGAVDGFDLTVCIVNGQVAGTAAIHMESGMRAKIQHHLGVFK